MDVREEIKDFPRRVASPPPCWGEIVRTISGATLGSLATWQRSIEHIVAAERKANAYAAVAHSRLAVCRI